jgi:tRNA G18 (ribose-2'-O)-methylase SpoU
MFKLGAKQLRTVEPSSRDLAKIKKNPLYIILDNVLDTYNVGAIFRLADAVAAAKVYLCGETLTPPNSRIKKASINTWQWVPWEYCQTAEKAALKILNSKPEILNKFQIPISKFQIIAVEQTPKSIPYDKADYRLPLAVVVGNETYGVSKEVLEMADTIVEIPMWGVNKSLNVMVSLAVVLFKIMEKPPRN